MHTRSCAASRAHPTFPFSFPYPRLPLAQARTRLLPALHTAVGRTTSAAVRASCLALMAALAAKVKMGWSLGVLEEHKGKGFGCVCARVSQRQKHPMMSAARGHQAPGSHGRRTGGALRAARLRPTRPTPPPPCSTSPRLMCVQVDRAEAEGMLATCAQVSSPVVERRRPLAGLPLVCVCHGTPPPSPRPITSHNALETSLPLI